VIIPSVAGCDEKLELFEGGVEDVVIHTPGDRQAVDVLIDPEELRRRLLATIEERHDLRAVRRGGEQAEGLQQSGGIQAEVLGKSTDVRFAQFTLAGEDAMPKASVAQQPAQVRLAHAVFVHQRMK